MKDWTTTYQNEFFNSKWFHYLPTKYSKIKIFKKSHPTIKLYCPITSPVRSIGDLWNQCSLWDILLNQKWVDSNQATLESLILNIKNDNHKSNYLNHHSNSIRFVQHIMITEKNKFNATIQYKHHDKERDFIYGILSIDNKFTLWVPHDIVKGKLPQDTITIQCTITKNPDPFRMIQVELCQEEKVSSIEDTKMES